MDIHKPKPVHSLKELASEIGVIVIGILIALGLEQAIETWHAREDAAETREAILGELHANVVIAGTMARMADCSELQLVALSDAIGRGDGPLTSELLAGAAFPRPDGWPDANWQTALTSGAISHFDDADRVSFTALYIYAATAKAKQERYVNALARLKAIATTGLSKSPEATHAELAEMAELTAALRDLEAIAGDMPGVVHSIPSAARYGGRLELRPTDRNGELYEAQVARCDAAAAALAVRDGGDGR